MEQSEKIIALAKECFVTERAKKRLDGWFISKEICMRHEAETASLPPVERAAALLLAVARELPLTIPKPAVFAGTQADAFARSYALINPSFRVESFAGYCDPIAVFGDIEPNEEFPEARIDAVRRHDGASVYADALRRTYEPEEQYTGEVAFFMEQVTGHVIPDMRDVLRRGVKALQADVAEKLREVKTEEQASVYRAMETALDAVLELAARYRALALSLAADADDDRAARLQRIAKTLETVPAEGARTLYEAIQSFMLLWQVMCLEQAPNPFAFSVGNADRIFEPYRAAEGLSRQDAAALLMHLLVFFNVGDRSWAISQNLIVGGRDLDGNDLTNLTSYALLDAYAEMNLPQPILSVKLHRGTPRAFYEELGRFFFTPGMLTPSLFSDDSVFDTLERAGIERADLPDYAIAGCQEPLIMGRDNGNTTNSWLNLGKILELTLNDGISTVSGQKIGSVTEHLEPAEALASVRERFYKNAAFYIHRMTAAANRATEAVSLLPVPFLSTLMGGIETGYDMRDPVHRGTKYCGSGCLIHGNTTVSDSFVAIDCLLRDRPQDAGRLIEALRVDFKGYEDLRQYLLDCPKFGNNDDVADREAVAVSDRIADMVRAERNTLNAPFRPDFSTPSTHLLYGHLVGALPNGRHARDMLNYGVDPLYGDAHLGLGFRTLSVWKLPFEKMCGGYASHFGIDPQGFHGKTLAEKGAEFADRVITPLFFNPCYQKSAPFYLYVNVTTPETLRRVLADPAKYAPSGVYIMRIHGTFVNFLDLSPAIQQDIITRLDLASTTC